VRDDGGAAFPDYDHNGVNQGMTLRDYFAAAALQGLLAAEANPQAVGFPNNEPSAAAVFAMHAYQIADAMLTERAKP
jgi:hypothetical protein